MRLVDCVIVDAMTSVLQEIVNLNNRFYTISTIIIKQKIVISQKKE